MTLANLLDDIQRDIDRQASRLGFASMLAANDTARDVRDGLQRSMPSAFDRPRPVTVRAVRYRPASRDQAKAGQGIEAIVDLSDAIYDAERVLAPHVNSGARALKAAERRLRGIGAMSPSEWLVPSTAALAGRHADAYGNIKGTFIRSLLGYFQAFTEAGYNGNTGRDARARIERRGTNRKGQARIGGVAYFIVRGRDQAADIELVTGKRSRGPRHLHPGIWAKRGTHGADLEPVFLFVRQPRYRQRWQFFAIADNIASRSFERNLQRRWAGLPQKVDLYLP